MTAVWVLQNVLLLKTGVFGCTPRLPIRFFSPGRSAVDRGRCGRAIWSADWSLPWPTDFGGRGINELKVCQLYQAYEQPGW